MNDGKPKAGTRVKIIGSERRPPIGYLVGRVGKVEHRGEDPDGCYVVFTDRSYMFCFYDELEEIK